MGRPSIRSQRRQEILDAFERCIIDLGLEGATLEKLSEYSGLARPLVRHHAGNRDELLEALTERFFARSSELLVGLAASLTPGRTADDLLDTLFTPYQDDVEQVLLAEALIAASRRDPLLAKRMWAWFEEFVDFVAVQIRKQIPTADEASVHDVAVGITGIYFNADSLKPLGASEVVAETSRRAARRLLSSLAAP